MSGLRAAASADFDPHMPPDLPDRGIRPHAGFRSGNGLPPADSEALDALWPLRWLPNTGNTALARFLDIHGEGLVLGTACASALQAIGEGFRRVRYGLSETVLCSGGDSRLSRGGMLGYAKAHALSRNPVPSEASRPFDEARDGFVPGEGGAAFVLESLESARARGAAVFAELLGFGASLDGGALTAPDESARFAEQAVRALLMRAPGHAVDWVSHTVRPLNDVVRPCAGEGFAQVGAPQPPSSHGSGMAPPPAGGWSWP
ncbi:MAG: beta-ketoacyl synthase N-terminal-like domain-containing protein [Bilophila wadsworthia]